MTSPTSTTWCKRFAKLRRAAKDRKRLQRHGTTPPFPIHLPDEDPADPGARKTDATKTE